MRLYLAALSSAVLARGVLGHNIAGILLVNGTATPEWKYVRDVAPIPGEFYDYNQWPKTPPQMDIDSTNITCGRSAINAAANTETADVLAGSEVGFRVSEDGNGRDNPYFWHPGPGGIYLSRAPYDVLENYTGYDGDWFKIAYAGPLSNTEWPLAKHSDFNFTIPATTPPGKYLMRMEQFMPTWMSNYTQFYVNCAHVNIIGPGGGTPTEFAKFPGTYVIDEPGLLIPESQVVDPGYTKPDDETKKLLEYKAPGPAVWTG